MIHAGAYNTNSQIKFKTSMLGSSLSDYSDGYVVVKETVIDPNTADLSTAANITNKKTLFKICARFAGCTSEINNVEIDHAKYIDVVILMYNLIKYSDNYSKISSSLW